MAIYKMNLSEKFKGIFRTNARLFSHHVDSFLSLYKEYGGKVKTTKDKQFLVGYRTSPNDLDFRYDIEDEKLYSDDDSAVLFILRISDGKAHGDKRFKDISL